MSFLDKLKKKAPELKERAADLAASKNSQIDQGIQKAAGMASKATKGKYDDKIDNAAVKAKEAADKLADESRKKP